MSGCACASCRYTDEFSPKGFAFWPRGDPAGARSSSAAYAAHKRACPPIAEPWAPKPFGPPRYQVNGINGPLGSMPLWWYEWNNRAEVM